LALNFRDSRAELVNDAVQAVNVAGEIAQFALYDSKLVGRFCSG
jgi:hypothetical protein